MLYIYTMVDSVFNYNYSLLQLFITNYSYSL